MGCQSSLFPPKPSLSFYSSHFSSLSFSFLELTVPLFLLSFFLTLRRLLPTFLGFLFPVRDFFNKGKRDRVVAISKIFDGVPQSDSHPWNSLLLLLKASTLCSSLSDLFVDTNPVRAVQVKSSLYIYIYMGKILFVDPQLSRCSFRDLLGT